MARDGLHEGSVASWRKADEKYCFYGFILPCIKTKNIIGGKW